MEASFCLSSGVNNLLSESFHMESWFAWIAWHCQVRPFDLQEIVYAWVAKDIKYMFEMHFLLWSNMDAYVLHAYFKILFASVL